MKKILYVVHRYVPYPGGSENHTRDLAEETLRRGHHVAIFTGEHKGDWNGVRVTSEISIFNEHWDLVVIHGGDVGVQNLILHNIKNLPYPVLYYLIKPSESSICMQGLRDAKWIGCGSPQDWDHVKKHNVLNKSVNIPFTINESYSTGVSGFREKYGIKTKRMFLSCGGFWRHKGMNELSKLFESLDIPDTTLVLTGYDNRSNNMPKETEKVKPFMIENRQDVISAIREADLYIMHSFEEGFGLVLLESMLNRTPWAARNIAGANMMKEFGFTYDTDLELTNYLKNFDKISEEKIDSAHEYVTLNHLTKNAVDSILKLI